MGIYEQHCNDYALNGNPERDHYDYEEAATFDRFDGWWDNEPCDDYDDLEGDAVVTDCFGNPVSDDVIADLGYDGCDDPVPF